MVVYMCLCVCDFDVVGGFQAVFLWIVIVQENCNNLEFGFVGFDQFNCVIGNFGYQKGGIIFSVFYEGGDFG